MQKNSWPTLANEVLRQSEPEGLPVPDLGPEYNTFRTVAYALKHASLCAFYESPHNGPRHNLHGDIRVVPLPRTSLRSGTRQEFTQL